MQIMTQDRRKLINGDFVSQFYIEQVNDHANLMASADTDILLGTYDKIEHAELVLGFIGHCAVDEDAQNKVTQIPGRKEMEFSDKLCNGKGPANMEKLFESITSGGGNPRVLRARVLSFYPC